MNPITINIITALNCEAKPLIDFYRLTKKRSKPFDLYAGSVAPKNADQILDIKLIVGGIGQLNTAAAIGWLAAHSHGNRVSWLNVGIAGHKDYLIGEVVRVCNVVDPVMAYSHYPALTAKWSGISNVLLTSATPSTEYHENALVDMEGAAFFRTAGLFASSELVQSLKVVSDNEETSIERLNATVISELIQPRVLEIDAFLKNMAALLPITSVIAEPNALIEHLHCTVSQRHQFIELVEKLQSLDAFSKGVQKETSQAASMKVLLKKLNQHLNSLTPSLAEMVS